MAMRGVANAMGSPGGGSAFAKDNDPELVRDALPFALKTYESVLAASPKNARLHLATGSAFIQYTYAFVHADADMLAKQDYERAATLRQRAGRLYLRGRDYVLRGLELNHPGAKARLQTDRAALLREMKKPDVEYLYWLGAGWGGFIASDIMDMQRVSELVIVEDLMRRALELDETFNHGAIHQFFITYEGSRSEAMGGSPERARRHFDRAVELTGGKMAGPYVALAASVAVRAQDVKQFQALLNDALAVDAEAVPEWRLVNVLARNKAQWLLDHGDELFVDYGDEE
jgi:predicted anti-sigma-YlaC factor YlaD